MLRINLALKQLTQKEPLVSARFWGKIYGTEANYIIAEVEYTEGEGEEEEEGAEDGGVSGEGEDEGSRGGEEEGEDGEETRDEPPKSQWKPPPVTPKEDPKSGTNKRTYFVCNNRKYSHGMQIYCIIIIITTALASELVLIHQIFAKFWCSLTAK